MRWYLSGLPRGLRNLSRVGEHRAGGPGPRHMPTCHMLRTPRQLLEESSGTLDLHVRLRAASAAGGGPIQQPVSTAGPARGAAEAQHSCRAAPHIADDHFAIPV